MIWVLDASVAVRWLLKDQTHPHADAVLRRVVDQPADFAVPELFAFEVFAVLCRVHPKAAHAFDHGIIPLLQGGIFRQPMNEQLARDAEHYVRQGLTGYDACYAALAKELGGIWLTFDQKAHRLIAREHISHPLTTDLPKMW